MRLTHPLAKLAARTHPRRILLHPLLEIFRADPARVQFAEGGEEGFGLGLELWGRVGRVCARYRVEKCPRGAAEGFDVWWAVGGESGRCGGCRGLSALFGHFAGHGEEGGHVVALAASVVEAEMSAFGPFTRCSIV